jgi:hypothetical protein
LACKWRASTLTSSLPHAAQAAFDAVLTADQTVERQLAQAQTAAAQQQQASAAVSTILNTAHARADERLAQARSETSEILALAPRMQQPDGPALLRQLYQDKIQRVLAKAGQVTTMDPDSSGRVIVPESAHEPVLPASPPRLLDAAEQQRSARQLQLALLAIGLLLLAGIWHFLIPDGQIIAQWLTSAAALLMAVPLLRRLAQPATPRPARHDRPAGGTGHAGCLGQWRHPQRRPASHPDGAGPCAGRTQPAGLARSHPRLASLTSSRSRRYQPDGSLEEVDSSQLRPGDRVEVRPGERIPADGMVVSGQSSWTPRPSPAKPCRRMSPPAARCMPGRSICKACCSWKSARWATIGTGPHQRADAAGRTSQSRQSPGWWKAMRRLIWDWCWPLPRCAGLSATTARPCWRCWWPPAPARWYWPRPPLPWPGWRWRHAMAC